MLAQTITVSGGSLPAGGNIIMTASQNNSATDHFRDAFIDLYSNSARDQGTTATQQVTVGSNGGTPIYGYISLQGGAGHDGNGDWAYLESTGKQTITTEGSITAIANGSSPFNGEKLGLGVAGGSGSDDYGIIKADSNQNITVQNGDVNVLGGTGTSGLGDDLAVIDTASSGSHTYTGTQTIAVNSGNFLVSGNTGNVNVFTTLGLYYLSNAMVSSVNTQHISVNGNVVVTGGTGQSSAASIQSLADQTIGFSGPVTGFITVQGGGQAGGNVGDYAAITSVNAQVINVTGALNVLGGNPSPIVTAVPNDDYALIQSQADQTITVGGNMNVQANEGSSGNSGTYQPLAATGLRCSSACL